MDKFFKKVAIIIAGLPLTLFFFGVALWEGVKTVARVMREYLIIMKEGYKEV